MVCRDGPTDLLPGVGSDICREPRRTGAILGWQTVFIGTCKGKSLFKYAGNADVCKKIRIVQINISGTFNSRKKADEKCSIRRKKDGN